MTRRDFVKPAFSLRKKCFVITHALSLLGTTRLLSRSECVINIPTVELSKKVVDCGNTSGRTVDKFKAFSLTSVAASCVEAPLIDECYANLECRVIDEMMVAKYNLFIFEVLKAWIDPLKTHPQTIHHLGEGTFMIAGETIHLPSKMK